MDSVAPVGVFLKAFAATSHQIKMVANVPTVPEIHFLMSIGALVFFQDVLAMGTKQKL